MYRYFEDRWPDPCVAQLLLEERGGPIRQLSYHEELHAVSFRPLWTLVGVLAIQLALIAFAVWLG
jgi:hypothetical protein